MAYEKKVVKEIQRRYSSKVQIHYHKWIDFRDLHGVGFAEPELFIELKDRIILFEVKRTGGVSGRMQLEGLYRPLLEHIFKKPVHCLLVCRWTTPDTPGPFFKSPDEFMISGELFGTWHWLP